MIYFSHPYPRNEMKENLSGKRNRIKAIPSSCQHRLITIRLRPVHANTFHMKTLTKVFVHTAVFKLFSYVIPSTRKHNNDSKTLLPDHWACVGAWLQARCDVIVFESRRFRSPRANKNPAFSNRSTLEIRAFWNDSVFGDRKHRLLVDERPKRRETCTFSFESSSRR